MDDPCIACGHPAEAHIIGGCVVGSCDCDMEPGEDVEDLLDDLDEEES